MKRGLRLLLFSTILLFSVTFVTAVPPVSTLCNVDSSIFVGLAQICIDDVTGLMYERNGNIARVYGTGYNPSATVLGYLCPGGNPGYWNTGASKVLFLQWDWTQTNVESVDFVGGYQVYTSLSGDTGHMIIDRNSPSSVEKKGLRIYTSSGAQWPSNRYVQATCSGFYECPEGQNYVTCTDSAGTSGVCYQGACYTDCSTRNDFDPCYTTSGFDGICYQGFCRAEYDEYSSNCESASYSWLYDHIPAASSSLNYCCGNNQLLWDFENGLEGWVSLG